jgi:hypothetical protein
VLGDQADTSSTPHPASVQIEGLPLLMRRQDLLQLTVCKEDAPPQERVRLDPRHLLYPAAARGQCADPLRSRHVHRPVAEQTMYALQVARRIMATPVLQLAACCPDSPRDQRSIYRRHPKLQGYTSVISRDVRKFIHCQAYLQVVHSTRAHSAHISDQLVVVDLAIRSAGNVPRRHHLQ